MNHLFQHARTGSIEEYEKLGASLSAGLLDVVTAWLSRADPGGAGAMPIIGLDTA